MANKKHVILFSVIAAVVLCLLCFAALFASAYGSLDQEEIYDGISFKNLALGGKTREQAQQLIAEYAQTNSGREITAVFEDTSIHFSPGAVGFNYDIEAMVQTAYDTYRSGSKLWRAWRVLIGKVWETEIPPQYLKDEELFLQTAKTLLEEQGISDAAYRLNYIDGEVEVSINQSGFCVDLHDFYQQMQQRMALEDYSELTLHATPLQAPTAEDIYNSIYVKEENATAEKLDGRNIIRPHVVGQSVNRKVLAEHLSKGEKSFRLKLIYTYPTVRTENIEGSFFHDVLATYRTSYNASLVGRTQNVTLAARKINGTVLNNGDIFSFNKVVGKRTSQAGFSIATVYTNGQLAEELGGGICQVSSTLYNAALLSDMKIVERRNHMFTVAYVKNGLDATVAYGSIDFRFQNSYSEPVKILATTGGGVLTVTILGTKERNIKVDLSTQTLETIGFPTEYVETDALQPGQQRVKQNGQNGYKIAATKTVRDGNGTVLRTEHLGTSVYQPLKKVVEVGKEPEISTGATPTAEPEASGTTEPTPTVIPGTETPENTAEPTEEPTAIPTVKPSEEPVFTETPENTETPQPTPTPQATNETTSPAEADDTTESNLE